MTATATAGPQAGQERAAYVKKVRDNVPAQMRAAQRWLLWKSLPGEKKPRKVPFYESGAARSGQLDSADDVKNFAAFEAAAAEYLRGGYAGLGFALGPENPGGKGGACWQGADLDHLSQHPELAALKASLPGYVEWSPSGDGVHAIGLGRRFPALASDESGIEAYAYGRFFTVTGERVSGEPEDISAFVAEKLVPIHGPGKNSTARPRVRTQETGQSYASESFFAKVNSKALQNLPSWVPVLLPKAREYRGGYRISSAELGRNLEEDLSILPEGIRDFGEEKGKTALDLVLDWGRPSTAKDAALWLCECIGASPGELGWTEERKRSVRAEEPPPHADEDAPVLLPVGLAGSNGSNGTHAPAVTVKGWPEIVPLGVQKVPPFPTTALPAIVREFVEQEALATQTPTAMPAMAVLCAAAAAVAKKCRIEIRPGWQEPLNLFAAIVQPPAARKTQVMRDCAEPLEEYEQELVKERAGDIEDSRVRSEIIKAQALAAQKKAARAGENREAMVQEAVRLAQEAAQMQVLTAPRLLADDVTSERLSNLLSQHHGRIAIFSAEGGVFDTMAGRYSASSTPNIDVYLKAHSGDVLRVDRMNRAPEFIRDPALTLCLAVQPDVIRGIGSRPSFRGRGLLGRILYALPDDLLGSRRIDPPAVTASARTSYARTLRKLLDLPLGDTNVTGGIGPPFLIVLSPAARAMFRDFEAWLEPKLSPYGDLGMMADWGGKLSGAMARIAGVLHLVERSGQKRPWASELEASTMTAALSVAEFLIPHARLAYQEMEADEELGIQKYVLRWVEGEKRASFTQRECHRATQGRLKSAEELEGILSKLERCGYVRRQRAVEKAGPGRPATTYEVNPEVHGAGVLSILSIVPNKASGNTYREIENTFFKGGTVTIDNIDNIGPQRESGEDG